MDPVLQIFLSIVPALSAIVGIIVVIRKSGSKSGEDKAAMKTLVENTNYIRGDVSQLKKDFNEMKVTNASRDANAENDRTCLMEIRDTVKEQGKDLEQVKGKMNFIESRLVVIPKRTKGESL